jgi:hypothetical protein
MSDPGIVSAITGRAANIQESSLEGTGTNKAAAADNKNRRVNPSL